MGTVETRVAVIKTMLAIVVVNVTTTTTTTTLRDSKSNWNDLTSVVNTVLAVAVTRRSYTT